MRVCIIDNPHSFRGPFPVWRVLPIFAAAGWRVDVVHRRAGCRLRQEVADALERGCELIVAAGGDGTFRELASELAGRGIPLGVLPGGTANVWAHELGVAGSPEAAGHALVDATHRPMDLGRLTLPDGRFARFALMAGIGFDGLVLAMTAPRLKRALGPAGIALGAVRATPHLRPFHVQVLIDGAVAWCGRTPQLVAGNTRRYANLVQATPHALCDDGLLDLAIVPFPGWPARSGRAGGDSSEPRAAAAHVPRAVRGRTIDVVTDAAPGIELDGSPVSLRAIERAGAGPLRLRAEPNALLVRVPRGYRGPLFGRPAPEASSRP